MVERTDQMRRVLALAGTGPVRFNVGCGRHVIDGWINIDASRSARAARDPDLLCDIRSIPLPDNCADELHAIHVFEHFYYWETPALLAEWKRLLKRGGLLALELPDIVKCALNLLSGTEPKFSFWGIYGDPVHKDPYMCHRWGWSQEALKEALQEAGFVEVQASKTQWHKNGSDNRDMRMTARKP